MRIAKEIKLTGRERGFNKQREMKTELLNLAAEILRARNMPSEFADDWKFCKTTPKKDRRKAVEAGIESRDQCHKWASRIIAIANKIK